MTKLTALVLISTLSGLPAEGWRTLTKRETITLNKGPPVSLPAGSQIKNSCVPAALTLETKKLLATQCSYIFKSSFEGN